MYGEYELEREAYEEYEFYLDLMHETRMDMERDAAIDAMNDDECEEFETELEKDLLPVDELDEAPF